MSDRPKYEEHQYELVTLRNDRKALFCVICNHCKAAN